MKVLIDLSALADNFSGIERYAASIAYELIKHKEHKFILVFKKEIHKMFEHVSDMKNVRTVVIPACSKLFFNQWRLPQVIRKIKADWYLFMAFPAPVLLNRNNMVSTIHDICCWDCPETMKGLSKWYFRISNRIALKKCRYVITISEFSKKRIMERLGCPEKKLILIYCGISDDYKNLNFDKMVDKKTAVRDKYKLPDKYILCLSTLEPRKNLRLLVEAYKQLVLNNNFDIPLVLAGRKGWKMDDLLMETPQRVKDKIRFTGFIDEVDLPYIYHMSELFVFPSKYEGFGLPPLEAMTCGALVLSSDAEAMKEVLSEGALYFSNNDLEDLKNKLQAIFSDLENYKSKMRDKGKDQIEQFDWKREADKLLLYLCDKRK
ncbi:MAG: glycosyltransferase family 4 protein [Clostridium sp.]|nr:glycosyltransferase family 4 protein [Clostridium sp.]